MSWIKDYVRSLKLVEAEEAINLLFYRPVGFILVKTIYNTPVTPNQVSLAAIFFGIAAGCFIAPGIPQYFVIGALLYITYNILDCSDGMLARLKNTGSSVGRIIDGVADYIATTAVYLGIAAGFALRSDQKAFWFLMLVVCAASSIVHGILVDYYRSRYLENYRGGAMSFEKEVEDFRKEYDSIKDQKGKALDRAVLRIYFRYAALQGTLANKGRQKKKIDVSPEEYCRKNRYVLRLWLLLGPSTHVTMIAVFTMLNRFDLFVWVQAGLLNILAILFLIIQKSVDNSLRKNSTEKQLPVS